jgi:hypothetical protein
MAALFATIIVATLVLFGVVELAMLIVRRRIRKPLPPGDIMIGPATRGSDGQKRRWQFTPQGARFWVQTGVTLLILAVTLPFLVFAANDHPWRDEAQTTLGIAVGYWLNAASPKET